jgi:hypothetical protein
MIQFREKRQAQGKGQKFFGTMGESSGRYARAEMKAKQRRQRLMMRGRRNFAPRGWASGGQVDSVPAMLTPGEFVMSPKAVQRHGVGYMRSLNRGNVPGFNSGGIVGTKYLQNGSSRKVEGGGLASALDKMSTNFGDLNGVMTKLEKVFSNLEMTHNFKGDMSLAFSVTNVDALTTAVGDAITPYITDMIVANMNSRLGGFDATGSTGTV